MKKSSALARFGSAVKDLFKCRKTKVSNDFKSSLDTKTLDQNPYNDDNNRDQYSHYDQHSRAAVYEHYSKPYSESDEESDCRNQYEAYGSITLGSGYGYSKKKRLPQTGSNVSKIPTLFEIPKINNPAVFVSSNTQKDSKPIKN